MFSRAVLFAHREGIVLEDYAQHLPKLEVIGVDTSEDSYVDTLEHPPARYSWRQLQSFRTLTGALRRAIRLGDIRLLGRVATASAVINEHFLPKPRFKEVLRTVESLGALGVAVAHSGTVPGCAVRSRRSGAGPQVRAARQRPPAPGCLRCPPLSNLVLQRDICIYVHQRYTRNPFSDSQSLPVAPGSGWWERNRRCVSFHEDFPGRLLPAAGTRGTADRLTVNHY